MNKFRYRLKEMRLEKNISQKKLAEILGTNNSSVCDWECGRTEPNIDMIIKICKYFNINSDYILGLED